METVKLTITEQVSIALRNLVNVQTVELEIYWDGASGAYKIKCLTSQAATVIM